MRILFFGIYDSNYSRNRVLIRGFKENGWNVSECCVSPKKQNGFKKYIKLFWQGVRHVRGGHDFVIVAFPGHTVVWIACLLFGKRRVIFDVFVSLFDSNVCDRKVYRWWSVRGLRDACLDFFSIRLARYVIFDTTSHLEYFIKKFRFNSQHGFVVPVGTDETIFFQKTRTSHENDKIIIHFHGTFIPLQGVSIILSAARFFLGEPFEFRLIGTGQEYEAMRSLAKQYQLDNVHFLGRKQYEELPHFIERADICLGIFGESDKSKRVIPNKVYECAAMGKPVVTADTPAIRELFTDGKDVVFSRPLDSIDLARVIRGLANNPDQRSFIGENAKKRFQNDLSTRQIVSRLIAHIQ